METKFKLRLTKTVFVSDRKSYKTTTTFVWTDRADALACQALLKKAENKDSEIEFVEFSDEQLLIE